MEKKTRRKFLLNLRKMQSNLLPNKDILLAKRPETWALMPVC